MLDYSFITVEFNYDNKRLTATGYVFYNKLDKEIKEITNLEVRNVKGHIVYDEKICQCAAEKIINKFKEVVND